MTRLGRAFLIARIAFCTTPVSFHASEPTASLRSGMPNRITAGMPTSAAASAASTALSTEKLNCPGNEPIGFCTPLPGTTNSG